MASTTSLLTGLSGLTANSARLELIGNNISNVNTTAFKSSRALFSANFSKNFSLGTSPSGTSGGTNPGQIGLGVTVGGTQKNFNRGSISPTGVNTDLAIEGDGFFVVERNGEQFYTRAGAFRLNSQNQLVNGNGDRVLGFPVDATFNLVPGQAQALNIPAGALTIAEATTTVQLAGNLNADATKLPTQGSLLTFDQPLNDLTGTPLAGPGSLLLGALEDPANPGTPLFPAAGAPYSLVIDGAEKGQKGVPAGSIVVDATTTVQDVLDLINNTLGIITGQTNPDGSTTGAAYDPVTGLISIVGNTGTVNDIDLTGSDIRILDNTGATVPNPFTITKDATTGVADGESVRTSFIIFDSLGTPLTVDLTMVLEGADTTGTQWRYFLDSKDKFDPADPSISLGSGMISFDTEGQILSGGAINLVLPRFGFGAESPTSVSLELATGDSGVTALVDTDSSLGATFQDGTPIGTLTTFSVGEDGVITGGFSNGLSRTVGQLALAAFTNEAGLIDEGNNLFRVGPNSGTALVTTPGQFGAGRVIGGALELSNVDLGQEFIDMILTSTGYSAASRVITTADQLLQQLVQIGR
ncbi:MAG: flagellar hook-basal body complex protein [Planctomycetota bacterium]|nr:MAG: flagellar hook-basal body complex protein [Planctomycetota bacterium]